METKKKWLGILVMVLVFGMTVTGCGDDPTNSEPEGVFTLYNIPSRFNGKYAIVYAGNFTMELVGCQSFTANTITGVMISNGSVRIPMWDCSTGKRYTGNHAVEMEVEIYNGPTDQSDWIAELEFEDFVIFSNGSATKAFYDGRLYEDE